MSEQYLGEIRMFAGNFAINGWAMCNGQILPISQNAALFSILGTTYGGNGTQTFALPDLRGRVAIHQGTGLIEYVRHRRASRNGNRYIVSRPNCASHPRRQREYRR
jgi:microcystin-dependent protein